MYVGFCITAWAKIEEKLCEICQEVLGTSRLNTAIVYFKTASISYRIQLVDELVRAALPKPSGRGKKTIPPALQTWINITQKFNRLLPIRSRIAHHPVQVKYKVMNKDGSPNIDPPGTPLRFEDALFVPSFEMFMSFDEQLRGRHPKAKPLNTDDLSIHAVEVTLIASELERFRLRTLPTYVEKHPEPAPRRRSAHPRKNAKKKQSLHPPRSSRE
jgi:hypothetical protein